MTSNIRHLNSTPTKLGKFSACITDCNPIELFTKLVNCLSLIFFVVRGYIKISKTGAIRNDLSSLVPWKVSSNLYFHGGDDMTVFLWIYIYIYGICMVHDVFNSLYCLLFNFTNIFRMWWNIILFDGKCV